MTYRQILLSIPPLGSYTFKDKEQAASAMTRTHKLYGISRKFTRSGATITRTA